MRYKSILYDNHKKVFSVEDFHIGSLPVRDGVSSLRIYLNDVPQRVALLKADGWTEGTVLSDEEIAGLVMDQLTTEPDETRVVTTGRLRTVRNDPSPYRAIPQVRINPPPPPTPPQYSFWSEISNMATVLPSSWAAAIENYSGQSTDP